MLLFFVETPNLNDLVNNNLNFGFYSIYAVNSIIILALKEQLSKNNNILSGCLNYWCLLKKFSAQIQHRIPN